MISYQILIFLVFASINYVKSCSPSNPTFATFKRSHDLFTVKIYNAFNVDNSVVICPFSLNFAMAALSLGAGGSTLQQIRNALNLPNDENAIAASYKLVTDNLKSQSIFRTATKLFIDNKYRILNEFKNNLEKNFDITVESINFSSDPDGSLEKINDFVNKMNNRMTELDRVTIDSETKGVLVNAVHFNSQWSIPFNKKLTSKKLFNGIDGDYAVETMVNANKFKYARNDEIGAELLQLPYKDGYSFMIILPYDPHGITEVEKKIISKSTNVNDSSPFIDIFEDLSDEKVHLQLPKFKIEDVHSLKPTLRKIGVNELFSEGDANLKKIAGGDFHLNNVYQKTLITVDEYATGGIPSADSEIVTHVIVRPEEMIVPFIVDHPFMYVIKHDLSKTPLLIGKFVRPYKN